MGIATYSSRLKRRVNLILNLNMNKNKITVVITKTLGITSTKALLRIILYCNAKLQMQFGSLCSLHVFVLYIKNQKIGKRYKYPFDGKTNLAYGFFHFTHSFPHNISSIPAVQVLSTRINSTQLYLVQYTIAYQPTSFDNYGVENSQLK